MLIFFQILNPLPTVFLMSHTTLFIYFRVVPQHSNQMGPDPFCWVDGFSNIYLDYLLFRILHIPLY